jgi:conjugative transposon TraN protein
LWGFFALFATKGSSQTIVDSCSVILTYNKTSSIIFPSVIKSVDRGSRDVLAQKAKGVDNVLQLKAGRENFPETNLTVITADGILHQFTINYSTQPTSLTVDMSADATERKGTPTIFKTDMTEVEMEKYATSIASMRKRNIVKESEYKMSLALQGIYIKDNIMFYRVRIGNQSNINYSIDFLKFYIRDKVRIKRTASQELAIKPLYIYGNNEEVNGKSHTDLVYVLPKFTIPESKYLNIELFEANGGRHFSLPIKNKDIVNARLLK